jgi:membrane-bound lytic murein transglycosylase D
MPASVRSNASRLAFALALLAAFVLAMLSFDAAALSRRDQAAIDVLNQRMQAAETKYREAMVLIGNADPAGQAQGNAALEDMEDVIASCTKQRGCSLSSMLASYKRLLKLNADAEAAVDGEGDVYDDADADAEEADAAAFAHHVPEAATAAALLTDKRHAFDTMVQYNPAVQAGIRRWLTDMRGALITSYENYQYMRHLMWPQYERAGLPEALLFGIMAKESNGRVHSTSRAGAAGPMQFSDDGTGFDTRYDPYAASEASVSYLNERMRELNRSIEMSLAAYNGGEGRALRVHRANGGRSFWDEGVYEQFPPETRDYVPMVIAAAWLFLHPKEYGLSLPRLDPKPEKLRLAQPSSIYQLTICLGNRGMREGYMRALRNLNPRYEADTSLPAGTMLDATSRIVGLYNRHCVDGARAELARTLVMSDPNAAIVRAGPVTPVSTLVSGQGAVVTAAAIDRSTAATPREYSVQRGETLTSIARKFGCSTGQLAKANRIVGPRFRIRPGQLLQLEGCRQ